MPDEPLSQKIIAFGTILLGLVGIGSLILTVRSNFTNQEALTSVQRAFIRGMLRDLTPSASLLFWLGQAGVLALFCVLVIGIINCEKPFQSLVHLATKGRAANSAQCVAVFYPTHD